MAFRVKQTAQAALDLEAILRWLLEQQAGEAGLRWFNRFEERLQTLAEFPERCALAPESKEFPFEVRQLIYGRKPHFYRVLFTIEAGAVVILRIRHGRRTLWTGDTEELPASVW